MELTPATAEMIISKACRGSAEAIDLSDCTFAETGGIVRLVLLAKHLASQGRQARVLIPQDEDVQSYLERANAFREMREFCEFDRSIDHLQTHGRYPTDRLVELRPIEEDGQIRTIVECFSNGLKAHGNVPTEVVDAVDRVLFETLQNIPDHADPHGAIGGHHGMAALQRYSWRLCLSVGDLGVGIRQSLTGSPRFPPDRYNHERAIEAAISGCSRHADIGRGGGLQSVVAAVTKIGGWLRVRSGNAAIRIGDGGQVLEHYADFPGTQIDIVVPFSPER